MDRDQRGLIGDVEDFLRQSRKESGIIPTRKGALRFLAAAMLLAAVYTQVYDHYDVKTLVPSVTFSSISNIAARSLIR